MQMRAFLAFHRARAVTGLCALMLAGSATAVFAQQACPAEPLIDVHVHAYRADPRLANRVPNLGTGAPNAATDGTSHRAQTLAELRRLGALRAIVGSDDHEAEAAMVAADPSLFRRGYGVGIPTEADLQAIRRLHREGRLAMIGEVAPQYGGVAPTDPRLEPLWALAEELQVPVGFHIGRGPPVFAAPRHPAAIGDPLLLEPVLARHPRLKLFLMHGGFPFADNTEALLGRYPNIYLDLGAIHWAEHRPAFHRYLRRMVDGGFARRILFGSDQMVWPDAIAQSVQAYREADYLTEAQRRDIFFNNAVRFFGWTDLERCIRG